MKKKYKVINIFMIIFLVFFAFDTLVFANNICDNAKLIKDIQNVFDFAKIIIPLLIIGLSSYEFIKALASKEAKDVNKAFNRFLKRIVLALAFFFLPFIIKTILGIIGLDVSSCVN